MAWNFDGTNDAIGFDGKPSFASLGTLSVSAFINMNAVTADGTIFSTRDSGGDGINLGFDDAFSGGTDGIQFSSDNSLNAQSVGGVITTSTWIHVGGSFLGDDANGLQCYVGGAASGTAVNTTGQSVIVDGASTARIGERAQANDRDLNGKAAEIAVWAVVLTAPEWAALGNGYSPLLIRPGSLLFYWPGTSTGNDVVGGLIGTAVNQAAKVSDHPRIIMPRQNPTLFMPTVAGGLSIPIAAYHYNHHLGSMAS